MTSPQDPSAGERRPEPPPAPPAGPPPLPAPGSVGRATRVVLVDDHAMFRSGVRTELGGAVAVVGEAATPRLPIQVVLATKPDVVLLDVHLPGGGGVAVLTAVLAREPEISSSRCRCPTPPRT